MIIVVTLVTCVTVLLVTVGDSRAPVFNWIFFHVYRAERAPATNLLGRAPPVLNAWRRVSSAGAERMFVSDRRAQDDGKGSFSGRVGAWSSSTAAS